MCVRVKKCLRINTTRIASIRLTPPWAQSTIHTKQFGTGNLQTLLYEPKARGVDTRRALMDFHEKVCYLFGLCVVVFVWVGLVGWGVDGWVWVCRDHTCALVVSCYLHKTRKPNY